MFDARYWKKLRYHPVQDALWRYTGRFAAVVAGRRSGKTDIMRRKLILQLPIKKEWPDPQYWYVLPVREQAKRVAWGHLQHMVPDNWIAKNGINQQELSIKTIFGSILYLVGADKPHRIEGNPIDMAVIDESCDQRPGIDRSILPMLAERKGCLYRIGVPKRFGIGRSEFKEFYEKGLRGEGETRSFFWESVDIIDPAEIELMRQSMTLIDFEEQFKAQWKDTGSTVYYNFNPEININNEIARYDPIHEIYVGCDFNVDPMCWVLGHYIKGKLVIFDEIFIKNTNTPRTLDYLHEHYRDHLAGWKFFGDASSRARKTSATRSDYLYIKNDARFGQKKVFFPKKNPHVRDRCSSVNRAFGDASGNIRCYISSRCKHLINDLQNVSFEEGTSDIEDYSGTDLAHMSDAFGYLVHGLMPIKVENTYTSEIITV